MEGGGGGGGEEMFDQVGFRFEPTETELIVYHLKRKIEGFVMPYCFIMDWDIYQCEPWFLPRDYFKYRKEETEMYFFTPRHPSSGCARKASRTAGRGYWDGYGRDKLIMNGSELVGHETSLVFKLRNGKEKIKTDWIMHEYRMHYSSKYKFDDLVLCKIYKKKKQYREELDGVAEEEEERLLKRSRIDQEPQGVLFDQVRVDEAHSDLTLIPTSSLSEQGIYTSEQEGPVAMRRPDMDCHASLSPMPPLVTWEGGLAAFTLDGECNASSSLSPPIPPLAGADGGFTSMTPAAPVQDCCVLDNLGSLPLSNYFGLEDLGIPTPPDAKWRPDHMDWNASLSPMPPLVTWEGVAPLTSNVECDASSSSSSSLLPAPLLACDREFTTMTPGPSVPNCGVLDNSGSLPLPDYFGLEDLGILTPPEDEQMIFLSDFFSAMEAPISPVPESAS